MRLFVHILAVLTLAISPLACSDPSADADAGVDAGPDAAPQGVEVTVMTWNLYLGTDIGPMMNPSSALEVPGLVADAWAEAQANDFPSRAEVIADVIAEHDPELIALQEVSLYRGQSPGDYLNGNTETAEEVWLDYLKLLTAALEARNLDYQVAAIAEGVDAEVPMQVEGGLDDLRLTDRDVILVRGDITFDNVEEESFQNNYSVTLADGSLLVVTRGWVALDATVSGSTLRFAGTHLEIPASSAAIQVAQGNEVIEALADDTPPVVAVGDLNSRADGTSTATYNNFLQAGYTDAWIAADNTDSGYTCCYGAFLGDPGLPGSRIDYVLSRGEVTYTNVAIVGHDVETPEGLHPSDHLGVVATFTIPE